MGLVLVAGRTEPLVGLAAIEKHAALAHIVVGSLEVALVHNKFISNYCSSINESAVLYLLPYPSIHIYFQPFCYQTLLSFFADLPWTPRGIL